MGRRLLARIMRRALRSLLLGMWGVGVVLGVVRGGFGDWVVGWLRGVVRKEAVG